MSIRNPKRTAKRLQKMVDAWQTLRPTKSFAGMTIEQFKAKVQPSLDSRGQLTTLQSQTTDSRMQRRQSDSVSNDTMNLVVNAVKGDPDEGEDGALYEAMGYVSKMMRRSGLTRKGSTTPPVTTAAATAPTA
jgi:hypothetical protein